MYLGAISARLADQARAARAAGSAAAAARYRHRPIRRQVQVQGAERGAAGDAGA